MIMPFDPFGQNHMVYTIKSKCVELPEMEYEDGASTLFLYTKGTKGIPSQALQQLLHYMEETIYKNAVNDELLEIHRIVETVKKDPEVGSMRIQIIEENMKMAQKIEKQTAEIKKQANEIKKQTAENARLTNENTKQADEITKQAAEIKKLQKELMQKDAAERAKEDRHI